MALSEGSARSTKAALVLCGGGSKGAVEAGVYRALGKLGIPIDRVVGTSIGAVNAAFIASGMPAEQLIDLWKKVRFSDLFSFNWRLLWSPRTSASLYDNRRLRRFLERHLPARFESLLLPLTIVGTDVLNGEPRLLERGNLIDAVLASIAIPGILPPVTIDGRETLDGGLTNNLPLDVAAKKGVGLALAVRCGCRRPLPSMPRGIRGLLSRAFDISINARSLGDLERYKYQTRFVVFEPCLDEDIGLLDFSHSAEFIEIGYKSVLSEVKTLQLHMEESVKSGEPDFGTVLKGGGDGEVGVGPLDRNEGAAW